MGNLIPGSWSSVRVEDTAEPRLDVFLVSLTGLTRSQAQRLIEEGQVTVNGAPPAKAGQKLLSGDELKVFLPAPRASALVAQDIPLTILFQDSELAVIEKPAGLVVHPAAGHEDGTLVNALLHHLGDLSAGGGIGGELRPGIVHRIDKNTSGILLITKTDAAHLHLSAQFKEHSITRRYRGLCWGKLPASGEWNAPIARDPKERKRMAVVESGRRALTRFRSLKHYGELLSAFEAELHTGRTHQVRVHFAAQGYALLGDAVYAGAYPTARQKAEKGMKALRKEAVFPLLQSLEERKRQFLHAAFLGFTHPATGKRMEFESELPPELAEIMLGLQACKL